MTNRRALGRVNFKSPFSGLGYRPHPPDSNIESTLIHFRKGDYNGNWQPWVKRLDDFLEGRNWNMQRAMGVEGAYSIETCYT